MGGVIEATTRFLRSFPLVTAEAFAQRATHAKDVTEVRIEVIQDDQGTLYTNYHACNGQQVLFSYEACPETYSDLLAQRSVNDREGIPGDFDEQIIVGAVYMAKSLGDRIREQKNIHVDVQVRSDFPAVKDKLDDILKEFQNAA